MLGALTRGLSCEVFFMYKTKQLTKS